MYRYRWYSDINWGPSYDSKTKAHYASASDIDALTNTHRIDLQSLQVDQGGAYRWVTNVPVHLGGISKSWHGEQI